MLIKADFPPELCYYLTPGKEYEVKSLRGNLYEIINDEGSVTIVSLKECAHVNFNDWQIVKE